MVPPSSLNKTFISLSSSEASWNPSPFYTQSKRCATWVACNKVWAQNVLKQNENLMLKSKIIISPAINISKNLPRMGVHGQLNWLIIKKKSNLSTDLVSRCYIWEELGVAIWVICVRVMKPCQLKDHVLSIVACIRVNSALRMLPSCIAFWFRWLLHLGGPRGDRTCFLILAWPPAFSTYFCFWRKTVSWPKNSLLLLVRSCWGCAQENRSSFEEWAQIPQKGGLPWQTMESMDDAARQHASTIRLAWRSRLLYSYL